MNQATKPKTINQHGARVGDILTSSWGYDQTNVDFYEVVAVTKSMVQILKMSTAVESTSECGASDRIVPVNAIREVEVFDWEATEDGDYVRRCKGTKTVEPMRKATKSYEEGSYHVRIASYANAYLWNGSAQHQTGAMFGH